MYLPIPLSSYFCTLYTWNFFSISDFGQSNLTDAQINHFATLYIFCKSIKFLSMIIVNNSFVDFIPVELLFQLLLLGRCWRLTFTFGFDYSTNSLKCWFITMKKSITNIFNKVPPWFFFYFLFLKMPSSFHVFNNPYMPNQYSILAQWWLPLLLLLPLTLSFIPTIFRICLLFFPHLINIRILILVKYIFHTKRQYLFRYRFSLFLIL